MPVMVQIRNMQDELHRKLKSRAALAGMSLSEYLMAEIRQIAARPTMEEMRERLRSRAPVDLPESPVDAIHAERAERDRR
jgi:plasmid stability protein